MIKTDLGLGHGRADSLFFSQAVGYALGLLAASVTAWHLSHHGTIVLSALALGAALLALSRAPSLGMMQLCLILLGVEAGLYLPSGIATIADLAGTRSRWSPSRAPSSRSPTTFSRGRPPTRSSVPTISIDGTKSGPPTATFGSWGNSDTM